MDYTKITSKITSDINDAIMRLYPDTNIPDVTVTVPTQLDKADFVCDVAFRLSKILHTAPYAIGESIAKEVNSTQSQDGETMDAMIYLLASVGLLSTLRQIQIKLCILVI